MMPKRTGGTPPPPAVYALGKRKERATRLLNALDQMIFEEGPLWHHPTLTEAARIVQNYRKSLDKLD